MGREIRIALYSSPIGKRKAFGMECYACDDFFCDGDCEQALNAQEEDIARHVASCEKEECYICQCM
jgi:hypothetical protein